MRKLSDRSLPVVIGVSSSASVLSSLPLFLVGAMAVQIRGDLAFSAAQLGVAVAGFRGMQAFSVRWLGRLADRIGVAASLRLSLTLTAVACLGIAVTARGWWVLVGWMLVAAMGKGLVGPGANRLVANQVPSSRQGIAFGVKQAAAPTATMIGGLGVPLVALTVGWRWAFVAVMVLVPLVLYLVGPVSNTAFRPGRSERRPRLQDRPTIVLLASAMGFGAASSAIIPTFWVDSAVTAGGAAGRAGTLLAVASVAAVGVRVASGALCDRLPSGHLWLASSLLMLGGCGLLLVAAARPGVMEMGVVLGLACGWGYTAVVWFVVVRAYKGTPGQITGAVSVGALTGASLGPLAFGMVTHYGDYPIAWTLAAGCSFLAAGLLALAHRRLLAWAGSQTQEFVGRHAT